MAFAINSTDIGKTSLIEMEIDTPENTFCRQKEIYLSAEKLEFSRPTIKQYLEKDIIKLSHSNFTSNLVLVRKSFKSSPGGLEEEK